MLFETICQAWTDTPDIFKLGTRHLIPKLDIAWERFSVVGMLA
jgi:hypothetical protein